MPVYAHPYHTNTHMFMPVYASKCFLYAHLNYLFRCVGGVCVGDGGGHAEVGDAGMGIAGMGISGSGDAGWLMPPPPCN